ncbi:hypothetical protein ACIBSV_37375 [Embleya sp. NPDC050154]|uniref:hypothetical protein n=1 Tax=Embleya sp. NPDC050154 TaxID=3363988 RepID=UPI00378D0A51
MAPFAHWDLIHRRRRKLRGQPFGRNAALIVRGQVKAAASFLTWLDEQDIPLARVGQGDLDRLLDGCSIHVRDRLRAFVRFAVARRLAPPLAIPGTPRSEPSVFIEEIDRAAQLHICLTATTMSHAARIIGALALLVGVPVDRSLRLARTQVGVTGDGEVA